MIEQPAPINNTPDYSNAGITNTTETNLSYTPDIPDVIDISTPEPEIIPNYTPVPEPTPKKSHTSAPGTVPFRNNMDKY